MLRGIYTSASGMLVDQRRLDVIANNLANASTTGFKRDTSITQSFQEFLLVRLNDQVPGGSQSAKAADKVGMMSFGSLLAHTATRLTTGTMRPTGNPLDVAVAGDGFFTVQTPRGLRFTRNGAFRQADDGTLVTQEGYPVMVDGRAVRGAPGTMTITRSGRVMSGERDLGALTMTTTAELGAIRKEGDGFWAAVQNGEPTALVAPRESTGKYELRVGYLEGSNVEPVTEMVEMMTTMRSYEANQKAIQAQDEALAKLVTEVGRLG